MIFIKLDHNNSLTDIFSKTVITYDYLHPHAVSVDQRIVSPVERYVLPRR